ncbi:hypothetical protein G6L28_09015 [Agrobacterium larrymoorei]|uniref:hypothetical protein n=1 Tax=Agrobacterium larrymoorei TaxID=160699 RepID=UPI00157391EB|nr:hypothetical protein [Agrobacterium larrymoorei]NTJ42731.1 hypothetical protein [Agrobacterium larrymoorei]
MKSKSRQAMALYCRSYLLTFGGIMVAGVLFVIYAATSSAEGLSFGGWALVAVFGVLGTGLFTTGIFGSRSMVDRLADWTSGHEISIVLMIMAFPLYWVLKKANVFSD